MIKKTLILAAALLALLGCAGGAGSSDASIKELQEGWANPPQSARTRVWWHWMNGNITKDGIKKDLEWMDRVGLGGVHCFDASSNTPIIVKNRLPYMHDDWKDAFAYAVKVSDSLGLEMTIPSSPGWSSTGGPWVEEKDGMKKIVWRVAYTEGGKQIDVTLPEPFTVTGAFQNGAAAGRGTAATEHQYYDDIAVIAVKMAQGQKTSAMLGAKITSSGGSFTLDQLTDNDVLNGSLLPLGSNGYAWIQYEYPEATTIYSATLVDGSTGNQFGSAGNGTVIEASQDGKNWTKVCEVPGSRVAQRTFSVPQTTAKYFRLLVPNPRPAPMGMMGEMGMGRPAPAPRGTTISEFDLVPYSKVNRFEDKAGFSTASSQLEMPTTVTDEVFPTAEDVVDVTEYVKDGKLSWDAPEGNWKIFRFGFSLTGKQNHPATLEATGLEVDKLDPVAFSNYIRYYLNMYKDASAGMIGQKGLQYILTDSYEGEHENWCPTMFEEFSNRTGYDLHKYLPAIAGEIIGSAEESDRFLFDYRKVLGDLLAENYDRISVIAKDEFGMIGRYSESHEGGHAYIGDGMDLKRTAEVPMSAMWMSASWLPDGEDGPGTDRSMYMADDKESSSVAHIYGQNVVAAESLTASGGPGKSYSYYPANLKHVADIELANGVNRFVIHESAHQPSDEHIPGMSLGSVGQWFNRHETWAEMAYPWTFYLSRSGFMLQAGKNVADILYFYGEDTSITVTFGNDYPKHIPSGYQWDYCSVHALLNQISANKTGLKSKSDVEYKVLWMDRNMDYLSVPVLKKIAQLAKAGVWIGGSKPKATPSLSDDKAEWESLVEQIWGGSNPHVMLTDSISDFLAAAGVKADVNMPVGYNFLHRTMPGVEIYWINKPSQEYQKTTLSFNVTGKKAQIWHPDTGVIEDASYKTVGDRTEVEVSMVPDDALFVVFSGKGSSNTVASASENTLLTVETPWTVKFQSKRGAPESAVFQSLHSYTEESEFGIKYFSGIATYCNTVSVNTPAAKTILDLGKVADIAEVVVNGESCGYAWKEPYRVDITSALKEGENQIEVKVANVWVNRLIGDEQPNCPEKITFTDAKSATADLPLLPAGLLGPVKVVEIN